MFNFRENEPSHCKDMHVQFQRKRTFTIVKLNMFNFSDNGPPMTDMKLCYWLWTLIQLLFTHFLCLVSSRRISYSVHI